MLGVSAVSAPEVVRSRLIVTMPRATRRNFLIAAAGAVGGGSGRVAYKGQAPRTTVIKVPCLLHSVAPGTDGGGLDERRARRGNAANSLSNRVCAGDR